MALGRDKAGGGKTIGWLMLGWGWWEDIRCLAGHVECPGGLGGRGCSGIWEDSINSVWFQWRAWMEANLGHYLLLSRLLESCFFSALFFKKNGDFFHAPLMIFSRAFAGKRLIVEGKKAAKCTKSTTKRGFVCFAKLIQF